MNEPSKAGNSSIPTLIIAPLDWGLGHATRCIPIIKELLTYHCHLVIAASGPSGVLLQKEFPELKYLPLPAYNVHYSRSSRILPLTLFLQLPHLLATKIKEHKIIGDFLRNQKVDCIISDNRPGLYFAGVHSIYLTHQIRVKTGNSMLTKIASHLHQSIIRKFTECWVPDTNQPNLTGDLSHLKAKGIHQKFIGPLSRFSKLQQPIQYDICIILSGPEPQRSQLESIILKQLPLPGKKVILIRGLPSASAYPQPANENLVIKNHLPSGDLNQVFCSSRIVIARSGYSTLMDLASLGLTGILIPTPGQTEQEYLGELLSEKQNFLVVKQKEFDLSKALAEFENLNPSLPALDFKQFKAPIATLMARLGAKKILKS